MFSAPAQMVCLHKLPTHVCCRQPQPLLPCASACAGLDARAAGLVMRAVKATVQTGRTGALPGWIPCRAGRCGWVDSIYGLLQEHRPAALYTSCRARLSSPVLLASLLGPAVVCTIHQPSLEIFSEFSELQLLKVGAMQW